jgi:hypothetical protein
MIVATPLDLPIIEPDNWEVFWTIWNREAKTLVKKRINVSTSALAIGATTAWRGLDIFKQHDILTAWDAPFYDASADLPKFYNAIRLLPFKNIFRIRLVSSLIDLEAHTDDNVDKWAVRALLHCKDLKPQWYFTKPNNKEFKHFFQLPLDTNWFAYNDKHSWHGTIYNKEYPKILLQIFMLSNPISLVNSSIEKYKDYVINL